MVDHIADICRPRGRVEIRTGIGRRRKWSDEEKGRIVAESFAVGAVVSEVARRHESAGHRLRLRTQLRAAIAREDYEEAARLRDRLRLKDSQA